MKKKITVPLPISDGRAAGGAHGAWTSCSHVDTHIWSRCGHLTGAYKTQFPMLPEGGVVVVNMQGAGRGHLYVNGVDLERYVCCHMILILH